MRIDTKLPAVLLQFATAGLALASSTAHSQSSSTNTPASSETVCSVHYVRPGETFHTNEGVTVFNGAGSQRGWIRVQSFPPTPSNPIPHVVVDVPRLGLAVVSGLETGDTVRVESFAHVTVVGDGCGDTEPSSGTSMASGGINVVGDKVVVHLRGSNNDVDFKSDTQGSHVTVYDEGTGNDIDLNGTSNTVTNPEGQVVHD